MYESFRHQSWRNNELENYVFRIIISVNKSTIQCNENIYIKKSSRFGTIQPIMELVDRNHYLIK